MSEEKTNILLVEDDINLGLVIQDNLKHAGYKVHLCRDGKEGLNYFNRNQYSLCILDVMLPEKDGFSLAKDIRKVNENIPIMFLTAKSMAEDKIQGFKSGGDDYLTKPFNIEEFLLRVRALLKRNGENLNQNKPELTLGKFNVDFENYTLIDADQTQRLTKKEASILRLLIENKNKVIERDLILNLVWGKDDYFTGRSLDVFITKLRKYLSSDNSLKITNVHGVGFKLETPEN